MLNLQYRLIFPKERVIFYFANLAWIPQLLISLVASFHVKRRPFHEIVHVCNAGFSCLVRFRNELSPVRGWALSFPVYAIVPSFSLLHIGRGCRQQRFFLIPPRYLPLFHSPFSFSISIRDISHRFCFCISFICLNNFCLYIIYYVFIIEQLSILFIILRIFRRDSHIYIQQKITFQWILYILTFLQNYRDLTILRKNWDIISLTILY